MEIVHEFLPFELETSVRPDGSVSTGVLSTCSECGQKTGSRDGCFVLADEECPAKTARWILES
jgi:hypothetical protein